MVSAVRSPLGAAATPVMLMPENAILVDEAATNGTPIFAATKGARAHDYLAPVNGGPSGVDGD